jgi:hypothetical protein
MHRVPQLKRRRRVYWNRELRLSDEQRTRVVAFRAWMRTALEQTDFYQPYRHPPIGRFGSARADVIACIDTCLDPHIPA